MKRIIRAWTKASLIKRILIGMILGATLGMLFPNLTGIGLLGDLFVGGLKAIAPIFGFCPCCQCPFPTPKGTKHQI